jgi:hypothetical protein
VVVLVEDVRGELPARHFAENALFNFSHRSASVVVVGGIPDTPRQAEAM